MVKKCEAAAAGSVDSWGGLIFQTRGGSIARRQPFRVAGEGLERGLMNHVNPQNGFRLHMLFRLF